MSVYDLSRRVVRAYGEGFMDVMAICRDFEALCEISYDLCEAGCLEYHQCLWLFWEAPAGAWFCMLGEYC